MHRTNPKTVVPQSAANNVRCSLLDESLETLLASIEEKVESRDCNIAETFIHAADDKSRRWE